jgi:hypothetical protein
MARTAASETSSVQLSLRRTPDVRFGSKADILAVSHHVRFTPKSGHQKWTHDETSSTLLRRTKAEGSGDWISFAASAEPDLKPD